MMDLSHFDDLIEGQDRGAELRIKHPVTNETMPEMVLTIAGPDSDVQRRAHLLMTDELYAFRGRPPAVDQERLIIERLARCVVGWSVKQDGKPLEFTFTNVVRILTKFRFVRDQVEVFAEDRTPYFFRALPAANEVQTR